MYTETPQAPIQKARKPLWFKVLMWYVGIMAGLMAVGLIMFYAGRR